MTCVTGSSIFDLLNNTVEVTLVKGLDFVVLKRGKCTELMFSVDTSLSDFENAYKPLTTLSTYLHPPVYTNLTSSVLVLGSHTRLRCYKRVRFVDVVIVLHSLVTYCFGKVLFCELHKTLHYTYGTSQNNTLHSHYYTLHNYTRLYFTLTARHQAIPYSRA